MRKSILERNTLETKIKGELVVDGKGQYEISTGIGFFDHMLEQLSKHSGFDIKIEAVGDVHVDSHHLIEDTGIVLGLMLKEALKDSKVERYASQTIPMDETLVLAAIDICNRPNFSFDDCFTIPKLGQMETEMINEFFKAFAFNASIDLHIMKLRGSNNHHIAEAMFKAVARCLKIATKEVEILQSTKGVL